MLRTGFVGVHLGFVMPALHQSAAPASRLVVTSGGAREPLTAGRHRVERPSKTAAKQEAERYHDIAKLIINKLSDKQTQRLEPMVGSDVVTEANLARGIRRRTGGRGRQQSLVARLLREAIDEERLAELEDAVATVQQGQTFVANPTSAHHADLWLKGLLEQDKEVVAEVTSLAREAELDAQRILQLARQLTKLAQEQRSNIAAEHSDPAQSDHAEEVAQAAENRKKAQRARKQLLGMLEALAEAADGLHPSGDDERLQSADT